MILKYQLFENLDKAKKLLTELNIPQTDQRFLKLRDLLKNNLGYMGAFTKWYLKDHEEWSIIEDTFDYLKRINKIDRPIESFDKIEMLYDYLQDYEGNRKVNQMIKALPSHTRENVTEELRNLLKLNTDLEDLIKQFYHIKGGRYNRHSIWWTLPKEFKTFGEWLTYETKGHIINLRGGFNLEAILEKAVKAHLKVKPLNSTEEGNFDVEVIIARTDLLMLKINNFKSSKIMGTVNWCISQDESHWNSYVTVCNLQYFVYDFTKQISDRKHMIGVTISPNDSIRAAHWAEDSPVEDLKYLDNI